MEEGPARRKRTRFVRPYPVHTLEEALKVAYAIQEVNAGLPFDRLLLAKAMGTTPASSGYTIRLNSSARYGLTQGGYNDPSISLTSRGQAIVAPKGDGELRTALLDAALQPEVFGQFYKMLDGKQLPQDPYAENMLQRDLRVHPDLAGECLSIIKANGLRAGILAEIEGALRVNLKGPAASQWVGTGAGPRPEAMVPVTPQTASFQLPYGDGLVSRGKVFLGSSGDSQAVQFVRSLLEDFNIPFGTPGEYAGDLRPVPAAVAEEMRSCTAAVLMFAPVDAGRNGRRKVDARMMYLLGAASAFFGDRIVVVVEAGRGPVEELAGTRSIVYDSSNPAGSGLALLREFHQAGVVRVSV